ncbi:hypothetical protein [Geodermatophilus marinus]|uniref:hypothetical protein n=1 Tax=Geodermatophilus sp. LHW52908 TaxID=2303986 RepID=UPI000E3D357F|nr:hypothetical protein [Geodermatophilus sp. LHW52908]RFU19785.1 hypothetical protein D0Z06_19270 [Geodermatophilus sp. LHW52908]
MTAAPAAPPTSATRSPDGWTLAGAGTALACALVGQFVSTPWKAGSGGWGIDLAGGGGWAGLALLVAFVAVALVLVALATARARAVPPERTARRAAVLATLGALSVLVFWTGLPAVLAGGAVGLSVDVRRRTGALPPVAAVAATLAAVTVAGAVWLAFTG